MFRKYLIRPILSWTYEKNWQFDQLKEPKRTHVFFGGMCAFLMLTGFLPAFLAILGNGYMTLASYGLSTLLLCGFSAFRIPYMQGMINDYMPEHIRMYKRSADAARKQRAEQESRSRTKIVVDDDAWRLACLKTLGLGEKATDEDIKKAHRKLRIKWHPDINGTTHAEERFKEIQAAYEKLTGQRRH